MNDMVITGIEQVSAEWLSSALAKSGALTEGAVASFEVVTGQGNWSKSLRLVVTYTAEARGSLPEHLFLKMVDTDLGDEESFGDSEVNYYIRDYADVDNAPLIKCFDAGFSEELKRYHILLEDVSGTHIEAAWKVPTLEYGLALAEGLAVLHVRWWGAERLAQAGADMHSASHIQKFVDIAAPGLKHILERFSHELKPHWPEMLHELFSSHPSAIIRRANDSHGFTLIHGDVGCTNILVPREGDCPVYIIDRQPFDWSLTTWLGVYDLAYAIVLDWNVDLRQQYEHEILRRYHEHLIKNGVTGYPWERLYDDYRLCVGMGVYIATEYCRGGINERLVNIWLPKLQRALTACDDLDCAELWRK